MKKEVIKKDKKEVMKKKELIDAIHNEINHKESIVDKKHTTKIIDEAFKIITQVLVNKDKDEVQIADFGNFSISISEARKGRNPSSGEEISIPEKKKIKFKLAKAVKDKLNP